MVVERGLMSVQRRSKITRVVVLRRGPKISATYFWAQFHDFVARERRESIQLFWDSPNWLLGRRTSRPQYAGRPRDEHDAGRDFLKHAHSSRRIQGDRLKASGVRCCARCPLGMSISRRAGSDPRAEGRAVSSRAPRPLPAVAFAPKSYPPSSSAFPDKTIIQLYRPSLR